MTVTYYAISILNSRTIWFNFANFILAILSLTEIVTLIPAKYMPMQAAVVAVINIWLRQQTERPVAFIPPGQSKPIEVKRLEPPIKVLD